jgi:hypothetical protein
MPDDPDEELGECVDIARGTIVIGAPRRSQRTKVYVLCESSGAIQRERDLVAPDREGNEEFGTSLELRGSLLVVGSPAEFSEDGAIDSGAAYIYERAPAGWTLLARLTPRKSFEFASFGSTVHFLSDDEVFVTTRLSSGRRPWQGHFFRRSEDGWSETQVIERSPEECAEWFGITSAAGGGRLCIGASGIEQGHGGSGIVFVYKRSGDTWGLVKSLCAPTLLADECFGCSLAMDDTSLILSILPGGLSEAIPNRCLVMEVSDL